MVESDGIKVIAYQQPSKVTAVMLVLKDADVECQPATTANPREQQRQRHGR